MDKRKLWYEIVPDGEYVVSSDRIERTLKFPQKVELDSVKYEMIKVITLKSGTRYISEFYANNGSWKKIDARNGRGDDLQDIHNDAVNFLKGNYVNQHANH
ncbi:MAG: hypothetical protein Q7S56_03315 [Nanoarchaeota archaeon]|nr:hypothetical protein [Nanoarchaeota archaeon]